MQGPSEVALARKYLWPGLWDGTMAWKEDDMLASGLKWKTATDHRSRSQVLKQESFPLTMHWFSVDLGYYSMCIPGSSSPALLCYVSSLGAGGRQHRAGYQWLRLGGVTPCFLFCCGKLVLRERQLTEGCLNYYSLLLLAEQVLANESFQIDDMIGWNQYEAKVKGHVWPHFSLCSIRLEIVIESGIE